MGVGAGLYMYDVVVEKLMFAILSDEFRSSPGDEQIDLLNSVSVNLVVHKTFLRFWSNLVHGLNSTGYAHQYDFNPIQGQGHAASEVRKIALW